jgi:single-strand DNA-binding protein
MESDVLPRINRVIVTGFLQQEPELRHTPSGVAVTSFRVRCSRLVRDRHGAGRETVSYFTVVAWADLAQRVCREAHNGQGIYAEGALHSRSFVTASGERKTVVEIYADLVEAVPVFLPVREGRAPGHEGGSAPTQEPAEHSFREVPGEGDGEIAS